MELRGKSHCGYVEEESVPSCERRVVPEEASGGDGEILADSDCPGKTLAGERKTSGNTSRAESTFQSALSKEVAEAE